MGHCNVAVPSDVSHYRFYVSISNDQETFPCWSVLREKGENVEVWLGMGRAVMLSYVQHVDVQYISNVHHCCLLDQNVQSDLAVVMEA